MVITETDVVKSINRLKSNFSCGGDGLPPILFKLLKYSISRPLALVYNQIISVGAVLLNGLLRTYSPFSRKV